MTLALAGILALTLIVGCHKDDGTDGFTDAELIEAIQAAADKQDVVQSDLPTAAQTVLEEDYTESYLDGAVIAPDLGYEVGMRRWRGARNGERSQVYFALDGRELRTEERRDREGRDWEVCFQLVLPVTFIMPDESTITINSDEDWILIRNWYEEIPDSEEEPVLQYPVDIIFEDGSLLSINNDDELEGALELCDWDRQPCFDLVYPVTYIMPDGTTVTIESEDEQGWMAIRAWYEENPDSEEEPVLQYPVEVVFEDGNTMTINNDEEWQLAWAECDDDSGGR